MLREVKSIEIVDWPEALEWGRIFRWQLQGFASLIMWLLGDVFIRARNSKAVNLVQQEHSCTLKSGRMCRPVVRSDVEAKLGQLWDGSDVPFPELVRFGMALECKKDWEDQRTV